MRHRWLPIAAGCALLVLVAGAASAGHTVDTTVPTPDPDDLGMDENDVRDESDHPEEDNGFPGATDGAFWSPKDDALILDGFVAPGEKYHRMASLDVQNIINQALHGDRHTQHEETMYPGTNRFAAWWGWWSDTGGGGDLQSADGTDALPGVGEANGAIDDADDCSQADEADWDEFTYRGPHPCPESTAHPSHPDDQLFAFVQPGTHAFHLNNFFSALDRRADHPTEPDFEYSASGQRWEEVPRPADIEYDSSLLVTTQVVTAANPKEVDTPGSDTAFDPFTPDPNLDDPSRDHAVDVDLYSTPSPVLETAYRTVGWDPGDQQESPVDALHEEGLKGWAKESVPELQEEATDLGDELAHDVLGPTQRQQGLVDDQVKGPFLHEPNTPGDRYGFDPSGSPDDWATHDPSTTYGGLDGAYYDPGPDQEYAGYQSGEHLWADVQVGVDTFPSPIAWGFFAQATPSVPSAEEPAESTVREGDDNTQAPGFLYMDTYVGTWYDENGDTWVGDAGEDGHPYDNGTVDDPNLYDTENDPTETGHPELRGSCQAQIDTTLYPTSDSDGDGVNDWGAAGVYVIDPMTATYGSPWMDVVGSAAGPAQDALRDNVPGASGLFPDRERLEEYRRTGPIHLDSWTAFCDKSGSGFHQGAFTVVFPTGTLDFAFRAETTVVLEDQLRFGERGDTQGVSLTGETIRDVDHYDPIVEDAADAT